MKTCDIDHLLHVSWKTSWKKLEVYPPMDVFEQLKDQYSEPHRYYHTTQHLVECLRYLDNVQPTTHKAEITIALWFHDAIYDVKAHDNEERSAQWANTIMLQQGVDYESRRLIHELIMVTKHPSIPSTPTEQLMVDIDLSILGSSPDRFNQYQQQIRQEYSWVEEEQYNAARKSILTQFSNLEPIYRTAQLNQLLEKQAKTNLQLALLS